MKFTGTHVLKASKKNVWKCLNSSEVLKKCIDGCISFEEKNKNQFEVKVKAKIGPLNATFKGKILLSDIIFEKSYLISGSGSGGMAGLAKGNAKVILNEEDEKTILNYNVESQISGKIAQLGTRLIEGSVKKYSDSFFKNFSKCVSEFESPQALTPSNEISSEKTNNQSINIPFWIWTLCIVFIMFLLVRYFISN